MGPSVHAERVSKQGERSGAPATLRCVVEADGIEWWDRDQIAAYLGVSVHTVGAYRSRGQMPDPVYFGRTPMWRRDVIEAWRPPGRRRD